MKISQMTTDQAADVLVRIAEPATNLMHDEEFYKMLEKVANSQDASPIKFLADNLTAIVTAFLKNHKQDVFEVVAALSEKTSSDVANQKITETIKDIKDCLDGDLIDFFGSLKQ